MSLKLLNLASRLPVCLSELGYTNSKALPLDSAFIFTQVGAVLRQRRSDLFPGLKRGQVYYLNMWENYLNFKMYECVNSPITEFKQKKPNRYHSAIRAFANDPSSVRKGERGRR